MLQRGRNMLIEKIYKWNFPIPYILSDDLGEFLKVFTII